MQDAKGILAWAIEIVAFLTAAFGGFLTKFAPPEQADASFAVGAASFLMLLVLLLVSAVGRRAPGAANRQRWIVAGAIAAVMVLPPLYLYSQLLDRYTYWYPPEQPTVRHLAGDPSSLTAVAKRWAEQHPDESSPGALEQNLPDGGVWTPDGLGAARRRLQLTYVWLVVALATAIFCLIEANASSTSSDTS